MYVIIVYDVDVSRIDKVRNFLRRHLHWVQNSVFEGDLTPSQLLLVKETLKQLIKDGDSIIIYTFRTKKEVKKLILGYEKGDTSFIIQ